MVQDRPLLHIAAAEVYVVEDAGQADGVDDAGGLRVRTQARGNYPSRQTVYIALTLVDLYMQ